MNPHTVDKPINYKRRNGIIFLLKIYPDNNDVEVLIPKILGQPYKPKHDVNVMN